MYSETSPSKIWPSGSTKWITRILFLSLFFLAPCQSPAEECGRQDYTSAQAPDFDCPSPDEVSLVTDLDPPPSIPAPAGRALMPAWDGVLVHRDRLIELGLRIKGLRRLRWLDALTNRRRLELEIQYRSDLVHLAEDELAGEREYWQAALDQANQAAEREGKWYRSFWFGYLVGSLGTIVLGGLVVYFSITSS